MTKSELRAYITEKSQLLADFGMSDRLATRAYINEKIKGAQGNLEIQIDNICHTLIKNYFDGDRTFVRKGS